jgi:hypothetical protein
MLGSDRQHVGSREVEPGTDRGVSGGQPGPPIPGEAPGGGVRVDHADDAGAAVPQARQADAGAAEALHGENDGAKPDANDAAGGAVHGTQPSEGGQLPPPPFSEPLHAGRHRVAGGGGRSARNLVGSGDEEDSGAGVPGIRPRRIRAAGGDFGGASLQLAEAPALSPTADELRQNACGTGGHRGTAQAPAGRQAGLPARGCIKAIWMESRASITSTWSTR